MVHFRLMGLYTNIFCPKCRYSFTGGYRRVGLDTKLGLPLLQCQNCGAIYKTGKKPWSWMTQMEKRFLVFNRCCQAIINSLLFILPLAGLRYYLHGPVSNEEFLSADFLAWPIAISLALSGIWTYLNSKKYLKKTEEALEKKDLTFYWR